MQAVRSKTMEQFPISSKKVLIKTIESTPIYIILLLTFVGLPISGALVATGLWQTPAMPAAIIFFVLLACLIALVVYRYERWYFATYFYDLTSDHIVIRKGPIAPLEIIIPYGRIQDVNMSQSIDDRIFGLYNISISSATLSSGGATYIEGLEKEGAEGLRAIFLDKIKQRIGKESVGVIHNR